MKQPPYRLRTNKAVDRLLLVEAIRGLGRLGELAQYTYYGLGGPYLEDFRLLHENFPELRMVSIEENYQIYKRQKFHLPCGRITLHHLNLSSFLARYDSKDKKSIFWLDYTRLEYSQFEDFMSLLERVAAGSIVKITLRAEAGDYLDPEKEEQFKDMFGAVLPSSGTLVPQDLQKFARLLQDMLQIAAQRASPSATGRVYQPLSSFCYKDGVGIFTLTGIVCERHNLKSVLAPFSKWRHKNLNWSTPKRIDVPFLSTKERLYLQGHLPCDGDAGRALLRMLGYCIDDDRSKSAHKMNQYAHFYRYFPYFVKAIP